jgi:hypothetical protein
MNMNRFSSGALLLAIGMMLGCLMSSLRPTPAAYGAPRGSDGNPNAEVVDQLKALTAEVKNMNGFLQSGRLKTIQVLYPDAPEKP